MNVQMIVVRGGAAIIGTALLAAAMWLYTLRPQVRAQELAPIRTEGQIGTTVEAGAFRVRVEQVRAARTLAATLGKPERTEGIFLIVGLRGMSRQEPLKLRSVALETPGGFTFHPDPRIGAAQTTEPELQPMIWTRATYLFELPRKAVTGARLVVGEGGLLSQLSAAAEIDLGLTAPRADRLIRDAAATYDPRAGRP